mgnify:CR=1 FL=1
MEAAPGPPQEAAFGTCTLQGLLKEYLSAETPQAALKYAQRLQKAAKELAGSMLDHDTSNAVLVDFLSRSVLPVKCFIFDDENHVHENC